MPSLVLKTAIGNYGQTEGLKDGSVKSDRFDLEHVEITPVPMIFRRMVRGLEFDVAEMALSTYLCAKHHGKAFTALPIFLTRAFYHGGVAVNVDSGIQSPADLAGKRIGLRSYTLTPGIWTKAILKDQYGLDLDSVTWVLSGDEHVAEYVYPPNVISSEMDSVAEMLLSGEVDAAIGAGPIDSPKVRPLFPNADEDDKAWHNQTRIYPISHLLVVKDELLAAEPWLAEELFSLFADAKKPYIDRLQSQGPANAHDEEQIKMGRIAGGDPIPYDFEGTRHTLEQFIQFNVDQKIIPTAFQPEELFPEQTLSLKG
ncbi:MAG: hypothetical protein BZY79_06500 [SAR202 cluster bacterium Casp-Chloro-G4]|nr:PhnD/SsuA/transferrin family substrate-binding protein [Chloroflexota bacterium]MDA1227691.1 PhnD/SsuA/transferrin family substrate-binding protein [Chloroflexota bacterium]PKB60917.1 MAG: hypothetical protein BZY79_06500 [SAR202 cluster bacterium Casp-Chloro-G4]